MTATATASQHMTALARANEIRTARATLKRQIGEADRDKSYRLAREAIRRVESEMRGMKVLALLGAIYRFGPKKAKKVLTMAGVSSTQTLGTMTPRQRLALLEALGD